MTAPLEVASFADALKEKPLAVERSAKFSSQIMGVSDGEHVSASVPLSQRDTTPKTAYAVNELKYTTWVDEAVVSPIGGAQFGKKCVIRFGLNGYTYLTGADVVFQVNLTTATGGARWPKWLGERLMGAYYQVKHANSDQVDRRNVVAEHFKRQLEFDQSSEAKTSYDDAVRRNATASGTSDVGRAITAYYPLTLPYTKSKPLVQTALSAEHELSFEIPALSDLLWNLISTMSATSLSFSGTPVATIDVCLRCYVTELDQQARYEITDHTLTEGLKYHITEIEDNQAQVNATAPNSAANDALVTVSTGDLGFVHPSAYVMGILRYASDLAAAVPAGTAVTTAATAQDAFVGDSANLMPDPFNAIPPVSWVMKENGVNFTPETSWDFFNKRLHNKYFNSENFQPMALVLYTESPLMATDHSVGHNTHTNNRKPQLYITYRKQLGIGSAQPSSVVDAYDIYARHNAGAYRQVAASVTDSIPMVLDAFSVNYNFLVTKASRIFRQYQ